MWADTHCHLDALAEEEINRAISVGVGRFAIAATEGYSKRAVLLAEEYDEVYFMAGIHPLFIEPGREKDFFRIEGICREHPKCIAIGEIGLDYFEKNAKREQQQAVFRSQLELAARLDLPVSIHLRRAFPDFLEIIRPFSRLTVIMHMFSGSAEFARQLQQLIPRVFFSFGGPAIRPEAHKAHKVLRSLAPERILVETDAPDLPPPGLTAPNTPANLPRISTGIAAIPGIEPEDFETLTWNNAREAFKW